MGNSTRASCGQQSRSPANFDLFPKLEEPLRGNCFSSLEELSAAVSRAARELNKRGTVSGIVNFLKRAVADSA